ncbi:MAG: polyamine ABC transporter substrate-binding protein [Succinivibrionaceae bacterium]
MFNKHSIFSIVLSGIFATQAHNVLAEQEDNIVYVYNWSEYVADDTISNFEKETGIKVVYDVYDSNEVLEAKLLAGNSGYDVVGPGSDFLGRQIKANIFRKLDKNLFKNYGNLDQNQMKLLSSLDPDNAYAIPYFIGTTGIGYNPQKIAEALGTDGNVTSWDVIFKKENISKLKQCGVAVLNAPTEIMATTLHYLGLPTNSTNPDDYKKAAAKLMEIRPYIRYFHSSQLITDLANGEICIAIGWSGDILQGADRAREANNGVTVKYVVPDEGALVYYDMMAIPADAKHVENAHKFLDYVMRADVMSDLSSFTHNAVAVVPAIPLVVPEVRDDPNVYIPEDKMASKMFINQPLPSNINKLITKLWTRIKRGK